MWRRIGIRIQVTKMMQIHADADRMRMRIIRVVTNSKYCSGYHPPLKREVLRTTCLVLSLMQVIHSLLHYIISTVMEGVCIQLIKASHREFQRLKVI